jgi:nucleoside-diphosphate-sugar epimerase
LHLSATSDSLISDEITDHKEHHMTTHVVVGAGPVGTQTALRLADAGADVRVVTRSGAGPNHPRVQRVAADAADPARMRELASDAVALYNCANPTYTRWDTDWPPISAALLEAAAAAGAVLATVGNLYGYGRVTAPMDARTPLAPNDHKGEVRAAMWREALAAHEAGRVRVV